MRKNIKTNATVKSATKPSYNMRITISQRKSSQAFTLIEMIGVLAVIAILASMLIPKIFEAINSARVNNAAVSYNAVKTAVMDHYGKFGSLLSSNGVAIAAGDASLANYDKYILLREALVDKAFAVRIGDGSTNTVIKVVPMLGTAAVSGINEQYDLDGDGASDTGGSGNLVEAVISGVATADAIELSHRLDGIPLSQATGSVAADLAGRVKYATPVNGITDVYIYIAHR
jgi:prepilin-type N-terminal cleavage/methylation domain-containing protein